MRPFYFNNIDVNPKNDNEVWVNSLNMLKSTDGGRTYAPVVDASATVTIVNGPVMTAHPRDPNVFYFVFGTHFQAYGTDLFRYDAATRSLTVTHNDYDEINAIAFSPAEPSLMYLGLASEQR